MIKINKRLRRFKRRNLSIAIIVVLVMLLNLFVWMRVSHSSAPSLSTLSLVKLDHGLNVLTTVTHANVNANPAQALNATPSLPPLSSILARPDLHATFKFFYHQLINESELPLPWFMSNGSLRPSSNIASKLAIWPEEISPADNLQAESDRIINQLMYVPEGYHEADFQPRGRKPLKRILLFFGLNGWGDLALGRARFLSDRCPVSACSLMVDHKKIRKADAVIFKDRFVWPASGRERLDQVWILFLLESPYNTQRFTNYDSEVFNWTATYRHDSDIVTPYEKFVHYRSISKSWQSSRDRSKMNYATNKTKLVAWFVSNCGAHNKRLEYARQLSRHIGVDIYGSCGPLHCSRQKSWMCFEMLNREYKFYLAFENSNCRSYITEKLYVNGLGRSRDDYNLVPIVMGGSREDYRRAAPPNSFIHVDDFASPAELAKYLRYLDGNDEAYNRSFDWKHPRVTGEFINTFFWCRLCALLHAPPERAKPGLSYKNIALWWAPESVCTRDTILTKL